jgi:Cu-Zn family superoxide dismutase
VTVELKNAKGEAVGTAVLKPVGTGLSIALDVHGLTPGEHAIHFHEKGDCTAPDFKSAGGHFSPDKKEHGFDNKNGPHAGDMKNFTVPESGAVKTEIKSKASLTGGRYMLLRPGGTALVIHSGPDDYKSQPAGNSGDRVACGVIAAGPSAADPSHTH